MLSLAELFSDEHILIYVCRCRAKLAKQRNRRHLIYNVSGNPESLPASNDPNDDFALLQSILPPRSKWKKLDRRERTKPSGQPLNSLDKTTRILKKTIQYCRRRTPNAEFLAKLAAFCGKVRSFITDPEPKLEAPRILAALKKAGSQECRPIALYPLAERIAISLVNRYLSAAFDSHFEACSFAFRLPNKTGGSVAPTTHHDAFAQILKSRREHGQQDLWVAECDIQKFFDTVNHSVVKRAFRRLVGKAERADSAQGIDPAAIRVFMAYLDSYTFNKTVLPLNNPNTGYFAEQNLAGCRFTWVEEELKNIYRSFNNAKIGVPQGGALSGLIANMILDSVDKRIVGKGDGTTTYVRYCDDMVIINNDKSKCEELMKEYMCGLAEMKLVPHLPATVAGYGRQFWDVKSKAPYKWGPTGIPWMGFVGYQVNWRGEVRVRASSLQKEVDKQRRTLLQVLRAVGEQARVGHKTIQESIANRLIQMSVGRVRMHNYKTVDNELCWVEGFKLLTDNRHSQRQMKRLDACRNGLLWWLRQHLANRIQAGDGGNSGSRQIVTYGKPFSYFYHAIERRRTQLAIPPTESIEE